MNKPKLFIIQACRGPNLDYGVQGKHQSTQAEPAGQYDQIFINETIFSTESTKQNLIQCRSHQPKMIQCGLPRPNLLQTGYMYSRVDTKWRFQFFREIRLSLHVGCDYCDYRNFFRQSDNRYFAIITYTK
jgi:hypothetical protein